MLKIPVSVYARCILLPQYGDGSFGPPVQSRNLVVNAGLNWLRDILRGSSVGTLGATGDPTGYLAAGTSGTAPAAGNTTLGTETDRKSIGVTQSFDGGTLPLPSYKDNGLLVTRGFAPVSSTTFQEIGLFANATSTVNNGTLLARSIFSGVTVDFTFGPIYRLYATYIFEVLTGSARASLSGSGLGNQVGGEAVPTISGIKQLLDMMKGTGASGLAQGTPNSIGRLAVGTSTTIATAADAALGTETNRGVTVNSGPSTGVARFTRTVSSGAGAGLVTEGALFNDVASGGLAFVRWTHGGINNTWRTLAYTVNLTVVAI